MKIIATEQAVDFGVGCGADQTPDTKRPASQRPRRVPKLAVADTREKRADLTNW